MFDGMGSLVSAIANDVIFSRQYELAARQRELIFRQHIERLELKEIIKGRHWKCGPWEWRT